MMKKILSIALLLTSISVQAGGSEKQIWEAITLLMKQVNELKIELNQIPEGKQGIPGEKGTPGSQGPQGIPGEKGIPGSQGPQGIPGEKGAPGSQGPQGIPGEKGTPGSQGSQGIPGEKGTPGSQGPQGIPGEKGTPGSQGSQGIAGEKGTPGSQGSQGIPGPQGPIGAEGPRGLPGTYTAGDGITIEGDVIKMTRISHQIGEEYRGGLVFYVDESGQHGLIASKIDVNGQGIQWRNGASGNKITNAKGDGIGAGESNTRGIIAAQTIDNQSGVFAALQAANFQVLEDGVTPCKTPIAVGNICYGGWYLPSAFELQLLHTNLHLSNLSSFAPEFYWSSTEASVANAWLQNFSTGEIIASSKSNTIGRVRAISRF